MVRDVTRGDGAPWFYRRRFAVFGALYGASLFFGFLITGVAGLSPAPVYRVSGHPELFVSLAVLVTAAGFALRVWASSYLSNAIVSHADPVAARLRVSGPYRFTRNPLYLGNVLQALGIGFITPWLVALLVVAGVTAFDYALIFVEEPFLDAKQGAAYARYRASVPRLIPLPGRVAADDGAPASLKDGLRTEAGIGAFALLLFAVVFANTLWSHAQR